WSTHYGRMFTKREEEMFTKREEDQMRKTAFTEEQIAHALRQAESGTQVLEVCRKLGISEQTFYRWKRKLAGMGVAELRRLRHWEDENRQLKQLVADPTLNKHLLQEVLRESEQSCEAGPEALLGGRSAGRLSRQRAAGVPRDWLAPDHVSLSEPCQRPDGAAHATAGIGRRAGALRLLAEQPDDSTRAGPAAHSGEDGVAARGADARPGRRRRAGLGDDGDRARDGRPRRAAPRERASACGRRVRTT